MPDDLKISAMTPITGANLAANDVIPVVDVSTSTNRNITRDEYLSEVKRVIFSRTNYDAAPEEGVLTWDADEKTLSLGLNGGDTVLQIGQESHIRVRNNSGALIANGTVVMQVGTVGNSGRLTIAKAVADGSVDGHRILGITTEDIANGADGLVTNFGKVRQINTTAFADGAVLYANPAVPGGMTATRPAHPNAVVVVAFVVHSHSSGTLFVHPSYESQPEMVTLTGTQTLTNKTLASPALTGTPTAPTAAQGTNTTQVATTEFANAIAAAYAQTPEDTEVPGGAGYSALHYAAKAGADALATAADRVQTGLDAAAAETARAGAETARDEAQGYAGDAADESDYFDTIALGRAAVADGASFGVIAGGSDGLLYPAIYRRDSSSTQTLIREVITRAEVTRINSELGRSRAIIDAPPVTLTDGRLIYPDVMTFDLRVISGVDANGLPWHYLNVSDVDLPDRVTVGARTVVVTEWSFDLRPLRGYYDDTGAPWPEDAGADGTVYPDLEVDVVSATLLRIYVRQWGATYVRWHLQRDTVPEKNADVWRIGTASEVTRSSDGTYTYVADICFDGETEMAILLRQSIGGSLKPDHIGGKTHGNEELVAVSVLLDGVEIGADAGLREVRSVELVQSSILYEPGDTEGTVWSPKGAEISRHYKHLYIGPDGWWKQRSRVEWGTAENFSVSNGYFGMLCLNAPPIITTSKRAPYWALEDVSGTFTSVHDTSDHVKAWGARYGGEVRIVSGWTAAGRNIEVDSRSDRRKIYPDFFDGELTVIDGVGAIWNVEVHYRATIKETV